MKKINLDSVPNKPGVYLWKDKTNDIIYVGKAKKLKTRMNQHLKGILNSYKASNLLLNIFDYEYIITPTEKEALILEKNYINKYNPKFNILLTDDKRYPYIQVLLSDRLYIKLFYSVKNKGKNVKYFGPYPNGFGAKKLKDLIARFTIYEKGLLIKSKDKLFWEKQYKKACKILSNNQSNLINEIKSKIKEASNNLKYELANEFQKSLNYLIENKEKQVIELSDKQNIDVFGIIQKNDKLSIHILFFRDGFLLSHKDYVVNVFNQTKDSVQEFIEKYYWINKKPDLIILDRKLDLNINVEIPQKGKKLKILKMAKENAQDNIDLKIEKHIRKEKQIYESIKYLESLIDKKINHILMIDNSNTNNFEPVSVIVSYRNGVKQPKEYRKYKLVQTSRQADVEYIKQGLNKYFSKKTNLMPDLFLVDGGIAQVNEARKIIDKIPVIGISKDEKHKTKNIVDLDNNIIEIQNAYLLNFLSNIQIEVDRYAKNYHSNLRSKSSLQNSLTLINGIGPSTEKKLLKSFSDYSSIYNASIEQLEKVVSPKLALKIRKYFNNK